MALLQRKHTENTCEIWYQITDYLLQLPNIHLKLFIIDFIVFISESTMLLSEFIKDETMPGSSVACDEALLTLLTEDALEEDDTITAEDADDF